LREQYSPPFFFVPPFFFSSLRLAATQVFYKIGLDSSESRGNFVPLFPHLPFFASDAREIFLSNIYDEAGSSYRIVSSFFSPVFFCLAGLTALEFIPTGGFAVFRFLFFFSSPFFCRTSFLKVVVLKGLSLQREITVCRSSFRLSVFSSFFSSSSVADFPPPPFTA